jgi:hypothetical protein
MAVVFSCSYWHARCDNGSFMDSNWDPVEFACPYHQSRHEFACPYHQSRHEFACPYHQSPVEFAYRKNRVDLACLYHTKITL